MKLNGTWTNFGEGESIYLRAVRLKRDSYNTSRTVHNQLSVGISPYFWIIKMTSEEILKWYMGKWTSNLQLDRKHLEEGRRWILYLFSLSITRLLHFKHISKCARGTYWFWNNMFSKMSFYLYIFWSILSAISLYDAQARSPSCPKFLAMFWCSIFPQKTVPFMLNMCY